MNLSVANTKESLWVEKYRPETIDDCILPSEFTKTFNDIVKSGELPNMIFTGSGGIGKTTVAKALCKQLNVDYILINCSEQSGIDVLRNKMRQFASSVSLSGGVKCIILDEADYLNANSSQPALRGFIEEFSKNCRFIFTCNYKNRIIPALHSRCSVHHFDIKKKDLPELAARFFKRMCAILDNESITYDKPVIAELINKHAPDWRRTINEAQINSLHGEISSSILSLDSDSSIQTLMRHIKEKNFKATRSWVAENIDTDATALFRHIYDNCYDLLQGPSIPEVVVILGEYQYKAAFVADAELNTMACLTEIMAVAKWKN